MSYEKTLSQFIHILQEDGLFLDENKSAGQTVRGITADSRQVKEGTFFICKGLGFKKEYLVSAMQAGAAAYLGETVFEDVDIPFIQVRDVRKASSLAARWFYGNPSDTMEVVGITGTKGKTTTAWLLKQIFDYASPHETALFSTGEVDTVARKRETHLTTPEPVELQGYFAESRDAGCRQVVMEVSSQAMKMSRVYGVRFDYGIFLNVDEDHIGGNEHPSLEDYVYCKTSFLRQCNVAVINRHTRFLDKALGMARAGGARCIQFGYDEDCDIQLDEVTSDSRGTSFRMKYKGLWYRFTTNLIGAFNVDNLTAAIIVALESGVSSGAVAEAVRTVSIPGRMLVLPVENFHVVIDYAHNHLSFLRLYQAVKETFAPRRIHTVFGCPGERSLVRRRDLGRLADEFADEIYLTADDPGYESVEDICRQIQEHIHKESHIIPDREEAVRAALDGASEGDVVILGGKGAESTQRVRGGYEPYLSDEMVVRSWIAEHGR